MWKVLVFPQRRRSPAQMTVHGLQPRPSALVRAKCFEKICWFYETEKCSILYALGGAFVFTEAQMRKSDGT